MSLNILYLVCNDEGWQHYWNNRNWWKGTHKLGFDKSLVSVAYSKDIPWVHDPFRVDNILADLVGLRVPGGSVVPAPGCRSWRPLRESGTS